MIEPGKSIRRCSVCLHTSGGEEEKGRVAGKQLGSGVGHGAFTAGALVDLPMLIREGARS